MRVISWLLLCLALMGASCEGRTDCDVSLNEEGQITAIGCSETKRIGRARIER